MRSSVWSDYHYYYFSNERGSSFLGFFAQSIIRSSIMEGGQSSFCLDRFLIRQDLSSRLKTCMSSSWQVSSHLFDCPKKKQITYVYHQQIELCWVHHDQCPRRKKTKTPKKRKKKKKCWSTRSHDCRWTDQRRSLQPNLQILRIYSD